MNLREAINQLNKPELDEGTIPAPVLKKHLMSIQKAADFIQSLGGSDGKKHVDTLRKVIPDLKKLF